MYVVCVTFVLKPDQVGLFQPLMLHQAKTSLSDEPGCHVFDVCTSPNDPKAVFLYEKYTDEAAFLAHLDTDHFLTFDAAVSDLILSKSVSTYETLDV